MSTPGAGEPLVLLHGLGSARAAWDPVIPALAERFDVIAVDLPGFGESAPLPAGVEPSPAALAATLTLASDDAVIVDPWNAFGSAQVFAYAAELRALSQILLEAVGDDRVLEPALAAEVVV